MRRERYIVHDNGVTVRHKGISRRQVRGRKKDRSGRQCKVSKSALLYIPLRGCMPRDLPVAGEAVI